MLCSCFCFYRRKVIGLDDLLEDYYKEKSKLVERESKKAECKQSIDSDEENDVDDREIAFSECVAKCEERVRFTFLCFPVFSLMEFSGI